MPTHQKIDEFYMKTLQNIPGVAWTTDGDLNFTHMVGLGMKSLGVTSEQILDMSLYDFFGTDDDDFRPIKSHKSALQGTTEHYEYEHLGRVFDVFLQPLTNSRDDIVGVWGLALDITSKRKAKRKLEKTKNRLYEAQKIARMGNFRITNSGRNIDWSDQVFDILGYKPDEIVPSMELFRAHIFPEDKQNVLDAIEHTYESNDLTELEFRVLRANGKVGYLSMRAKSLHKDDILLGIEGILQDISDRKTVEEKLENSLALMDSVLESPKGIMVYALDRNYCYTGFNRNHMTLMKKNWGAVIKKGMNILDIIDDEDKKEELKKNIDKALFGGHFNSIEEIDYGDIKVYVDHNFNPIVTKDGSITGMTVFSSDITQYKEAENKITQMNDELEERVQIRTYQLEDAMQELKTAQEELRRSLDREREINSLKTRFINSVSHEYRTPLTVIMSATELIDMFLENGRIQEAGEYLEKIKYSVKSMTKMIDDVLTYGKAEEIKMDRGSFQFELKDLCMSLVEEVKQIDRKNHKFTVETSCKDCVISSDPKLIKQILFNLLENAIKYSDNETEIKLVLNEDDDKFEILIIDQGIGMKESDQYRLFEPFSRKKKHIGIVEGTGLGLALTKSFAEMHGGELNLSSIEGEGTTVTFTLPIAGPGEMEEESGGRDAA